MKTLLTEEELRTGVERLAVEISAAYDGRPLTIVGVLTGSLVLLADLIRELDMPLRVGVLQARSYQDGTTRGNLTINSEMMLDITGRDVLVFDDIFDTGHTMVEVVALLKDLDPSSIKTAVLLRKQARCEVEYNPDFVAFDIPNEFVVGYVPATLQYDNNSLYPHHSV